MYFKDKDGRMWLQTENGFQNIGVSVKKETVTFKKIASVEIIPSSVVVLSIEGAVPMTLRQAVSKLGIMSVMSQSAFQKNIDTVWSIFYGKNFYGMSDKTEITVTPAISPLGENSSPEELQQKYLAAVDWEDVSEET